MLEQYIRERLREKKLLLMTHIVLGYPSLKVSLDIVDAMVAAGVDLMELQIPFSEPIADGPVILKANQEALARGIKVAECFEFARKATARHAIPFLFMTYYNILFRYGVQGFAEKMKKCGVAGAIVPDLPPEEADDYLAAMERHGRDPIFIYSPNTPPERMRYLDAHAKGFVYCVARKGVTGSGTDFSHSVSDYLNQCRASTRLPLALGFGVKDRSDVAFLKGKADIAVIGSQTIRITDESGPEAAGMFVADMVDASRG